MIRIGIIGYRRHASKHIALLRKNNNVSDLRIYHPSNKSSEITNNFEDLIESDGIIISSPTFTHCDYIQAG